MGNKCIPRGAQVFWLKLVAESVQKNLPNKFTTLKTIVT